MKKILVFGSSNTDMVIQAEHLPLPGETILGGKFAMHAGGKGANQAVAAARMGGNVTFIAKVGNDLFGQQARQQFITEGITTDYILTDPDHPSGVALITVDNKGENSIVVASGSNATLSPSDVSAAIELINSDTIVLLQLEIPIPTVEYIIEQSNSRGAQVILNPAPANSLHKEIYNYLYLLTPNETELSLLTNTVVNDIPSAERAAQILHKRGVKNIIVTMGASGAFWYSGTDSQLIPAPKVDAIDTTGAGDIFNGVLCVFLAEGYSLPEAIHYACQASSISVTRMGAQSSAPYRKELQQVRTSE
ncbi:ribokinase [Cytophagaceae bacterium YF14B1]|uniref:Ribokinase n=1 Tax=Xanthocytophaga flava TaxID=3048013 RepID=A0AAE3QR71_9BACT|nr:ribokinase [Xanthocytophaga flavus]MDJ1483982.1 ribokinase [Xanthocytophaga flavus]